MYKKILVLGFFVLLLSLASISYGADPRMIKLDLNNTDNNDDANTHAGFTKFSIADSGSEVNSVVIDLAGNIDSRLRVDPNGRAFDDIYRDFIFGISPSGVTITLWGLGVNRDCNITIWAYDDSSEPTRAADWFATWGDINDANYIFTADFNGGAGNWPAGDGSTNYFGTAKADSMGRITLTSARDTNSPAGQPFAFVNALMVEPRGTFVETNYAHRPQPANGADGVTEDDILSWRKGGLADKHDVYLGTSYNSVHDAIRDFPLGVLVSENQDANTFDLTGQIEEGYTYYWRIDEYNSVTETFWTGEVWSFSTYTINQPTAWWKLDEVSGSIAYDSSDNHYDANIYGDPVWRAGSPYGGSGYLDFDGNGDYTDANYIDGGDIVLPDYYTVTLWFKSEGEGQQAERDMFSAVAINEGHGIMLEIRDNDTPSGRIRYLHRSPVQGSGTYNESLYTPLGYDDGAWHHIAVERASDGRYIYIDGEEVLHENDSRNGLLFEDGSAAPLRIMFGTVRPGLLQRFWDGGIDDVRIYNRALSPDEVREVMRSAIASAPNPPDGTTEVGKTPSLSWLAGLYAADVNGHRLYLDTDEQKVEERSGCLINGVPTTDPCYGPIGPLGVGLTYYWAIDEVNDATAPYIWVGDIWSFTTVPYTVVEDFEEYGIGGLTIRDRWDDYWANGTNSEVFRTSDPALDTQSMEYNFENSYGGDSEAEYDITQAGVEFETDWDSMGAKVISLSFYGKADNPITEKMYVKLVDGDEPAVTGKVTYPDMNAITVEDWQDWDIALQQFVDDNDVNLANVASIIIGFAEGAQVDGIVYFDNIRLWASKCALLYRSPGFALVDFAPISYSTSGDCEVGHQELTILVDDWLAEDGVVATQNPGDANLVAYYPLDEGDGNDVEDVVGDHNGVLAGDVSWITPGLIGNSAIHVPYSEDGGHMVDINTWNPVGNWDSDTNTGELTLSIWAKWAGPTGVEQGLICKRDLAWDVNGLMFGLVITDWPAFPPLQLALRGTTDVVVGGTMENYTGKWTHLAATYPHPSGDPCDPNLFARLYINGREVASGAYTFGPNSVASMAIGKTTGKNGDVGENQTFEGDLDEVRIYNRALEPNEIAYIADLTPGDGVLHIPVPSFAEIYAEEPEGQRAVNFKDFALIANKWLTEEYWP